ncbi:MAG TPA: beta-ketoacyl-[acyl-carrier-protein] synthase family protein [Polyangiaceae bacterium]|nr:beta-ketoacyl-[acyl-carrier-protein] synthase family protein [Polyangiaceae bacterium]
MRRIAVTGVGAVTPLGLDVGAFWRGLLEGKSGVSFITDFPTDKLRSDIAARVDGLDPERFLTKKESELFGRVAQFSVAAATEAVDQAGFASWLEEGIPGGDLTAEQRAQLPKPDVDPTRFGCLMSTGQGAVDIFEQQIAKSADRGPRAVSPFFIPSVMPNNPSAMVSMRYGLMGPSYGLSSACATGTHSIATCAMMIALDEADVMVAGGAEAATRLNTVAGFGNARALTKAWEGDPTRASRPFDVGRRGFVMGEGAGVLVLEAEEHAKARGAEILAYVAGWGLTSDGQHLTSPHADGLGVRIAMERALKRAGITPDDVGYINPHATSTKLGDVAEIRALRQVFGDRLPKTPISATKSMVGHLLGGAGAVESIATICSLRDGKLHPSINLDELDPELAPLDVVLGGPRDVDARYALKISAGFGGHNCALVFERASDRA